jgi:hypothetical protein
MNDRSFDEELQFCPDCGEPVTVEKTRPEGGKIYRNISCNADCGFKAVETFKHTNTTEVENYGK